MKKIGLEILIAIVITVLAVSVAFALPSNKGINRAKEVSPAITNEGIKSPPEFVADLPESALTKTVFIRYVPSKEPTCDNDGICEPKENWKNCPNDCQKGGDEEPVTICYDFLSGAKPRWNWIENYVYNDESLETPSSDAVNTWEAPVLSDIFGNGIYSTSTQYAWDQYDSTNLITYGDFDDTGMCPTPESCVIAVTAIWFRGKNIYEYDIMFDTDFFPGDFDLPTVTLHEFGHAAGLDDLYDSVCSENVMHGYYTGVRTTLGEGDTLGIQTLYSGF